MKVSQNILCVDVGFRNTGFAVWNTSKECFVFSRILSCPPHKEDYVMLETQRVVNTLADSLSYVVDRFSPFLILAELPTGASRSSRSASCMSAAASCFITFCRVRGLRYRIIRPSEIKNWARYQGRKSVPKEVVIKCVSEQFGSSLLPESAKQEHVADAMACLGVFLSHGRSKRSLR